MAPSASGRPYFWHRISRRSVWKLPLGASVRKKKGRRKRKKRKRRTPRTCSRSLCARARRRQRQWHLSGFPCDVSPRAVFPLVVVWPEMPCIMAGMTRRTRTALVSGCHLFAVLLGSTVDTCYVSLQRLLWEIAENVPFSAQCLVRQWLWEMTSWQCRIQRNAWFDSGYMVLPVYVAIPQVQLLDKVVCPDPEVHHSGGAAVAVPLQGRPHPRRCAETAFHGLTCQRPLRFSCCSTLTRWMMLVVRVVQILFGAVVEETVELRRLHSLRNLSSGAAHHRVDELMG